MMRAVDDTLMEQMVEFPTHIKGNILDLVLTNMPERVVELLPHGRLGQSDHESILLTVDRAGGPEVVKVVKNWRRADWAAMRADLGRPTWKRTLRGTAHQMWSNFKSRVLGAVRKHVPMKRVRAGGRPAWIGGELLAAVKRKRRLWRQVKGGTIPPEYTAMEKS